MKAFIAHLKRYAKWSMRQIDLTVSCLYEVNTVKQNRLLLTHTWPFSATLSLLLIAGLVEVPKFIGPNSLGGPLPSAIASTNSCQPGKTNPALWPSGVFYHGNPGSQKRVALTFDDGPYGPISLVNNNGATAGLLLVLYGHNAPATFFVIGDQVASGDTLVGMEVGGGALIGNHSWSHPHLTSLDSAAISDELSKTSDAIKSAIGVPPSLFRPPFGDIDNNVVTQALNQNLTPIGWSIDS